MSQSKSPEWLGRVRPVAGDQSACCKLKTDAITWILMELSVKRSGLESFDLSPPWPGREALVTAAEKPKMVVVARM